MMNWLHRFLVPSEKNGYKPTSLEATASGIMLVLIMLTFAIANVQSILLISSDWFVSTILPAALVQMTNEERGSEALSELTRNELLDKAAQLKADDMAKGGYFSHDSPTGVTPWYWFREAGYHYVYAGENLAVHFSDSEEVVDAWMDSPGHRANIMGEKYSEIGIGTAKGTYKGAPTVFVVQLFGTPIKARKIPPANQVAIALTTQDETILENEPAVLAAQNSPEDRPPEEDSVPPIEVSAVPAEVAPNRSPKALPSESGVSAVTAPEGGNLVLSIDTPVLNREPPTLFIRIANFFEKVLVSPHTFISLSYLLLTFVAVTMLAFSVVVEWRRQHPVQVAYGVGLMAAMFLLFTMHISLTGGVLIV